MFPNQKSHPEIMSPNCLIIFENSLGGWLLYNQNIPYFYTKIQHQQIYYHLYQTQATFVTYPLYNVALPPSYFTSFNNLVCGEPPMSYQTLHYSFPASNIHYVPLQHSQIIPNTKPRKYVIPIINPDSLKIQPRKSLIKKDIFTQTDKIEVKSVSVQAENLQNKENIAIAEESLQPSTANGGCCKINRKGAKRKEKYKKLLKRQQKRSNKLLAC